MPETGPVEFIKELFDYPSAEFTRHLLREGNSHIVFSGKFGIGKTFFLDHYFKDETQHSVLKGTHHFTSFTLRPVHYSIATNEDIYRYIKYDIVYQFLDKRLPLHENDFHISDTMSDFFNNHMEDVFRTVITMVPKIGESFVRVHDSLKMFFEKMREHHNTLRASEGQTFVEFLETVQNDKQSLYENDILVQMIRKVLDRSKQISNKQNVLIIDDLDRIDPEHIFRLLNVFAARLDIGNIGTPGLGFDKIIIVCDIKNIRSIFQSRYGIRTDFNGYIDKFYSDETFFFDNRKTLQKIAEEAFTGIQVIGSPTVGHEKHLTGKLFNYSSLAVELLRMFVQAGLTNLRVLLNKKSFPIRLDFNERLMLGDGLQIELIEHPLLAQFKILQHITDGYPVMLEKISRLSDFELDFSARQMNDYGRQMVYYLTVDIHKFRETKTFLTYQINHDKAQYKVVGSFGSEKFLIGHPEETTLTEDTRFQFTKDAFKVVLERFIKWLAAIRY
jgi:hypothetical protein